MPRFLPVRAAVCCAFAAAPLFLGSAALAQTPPPAPTPTRPVTPSGLPPLGLPQDAGPHDGSAAIEWWYFNSFLTGESGHKWAVVGSFFRTGLPGGKKGHYLIYSLADLDASKTQSYSIIDPDNAALLKTFLSAQALQNPSDPRPLQFLARLKNNNLPAPHRLAKQSAAVKTSPLFSVALQNNSFEQTAPDARTWQAKLVGDDWGLNLDFTQETRPPMLVGGEGRTGLRTPGDMAYVSLTRAETSGTLTVGGKVEKVTGMGWIDRQWGTSWVAQNNGWDWWGVQLSDGSDLIVYRVRDNATGEILRAEATLLRADGTQAVEKAPVFSTHKAAVDTRWKDPQTSIAFPLHWKINLPTLGVSLQIAPAYSAQTIPVLGIGDAIWEGVVHVSGTSESGKTLITGQGYMELVGYQKSASASGAKPAKAAKATLHAKGHEQ